MEDAAIVALYWDRNENAIVETDKKYGPYCRAIAQNILSVREDAEECVNDSYHNAWNAMPPQKPDSLPPFLGRIVRNLSISRWRREHAKKRGMLAPVPTAYRSNFVIFIMDFEPKTKKTIYRFEDLPEFLETVKDIAVFHFFYEDVYIGFSPSELSTEEILTVVNSIPNKVSEPT